jgi:hypothetical protein
MNLDRARLEEALTLMGSFLDDQKVAYELVAIGGSGLLLLGIIERSTRDLDVIATVQPEGYRRADILPAEICQARDIVADHLDLEKDWLNSAPRSILNPALPNGGLPVGFQERAIVQKFGGLTLHLASRLDQICFKLHAAVDRGDPRGKHVQDLIALAPTNEELLWGGRWCRLQDPSEGFLSMLVQVLEMFGVQGVEDGLR